MRYTHSLKIIRKRRHAFKISILITGVLVVLILVLGFTTLDAKQFFFGFLQSLFRVIIAYFVAGTTAILLSLLVTTSKRFEALILPVLDVLQSFPSFALYPLMALWFGKNSIVTIIILMLEMVWPILFTIVSAQKQFRADILEAGYIYGARKFKHLIFVEMPMLLPSFVTGSIVAWGEAWEAIIAAEIIVDVPFVIFVLLLSSTICFLIFGPTLRIF